MAEMKSGGVQHPMAACDFSPLKSQVLDPAPSDNGRTTRFSEEINIYLTFSMAGRDVDVDVT